VVVVDQHVLGKPANIEEAVRMLHRLSEREHEVITGICLRAGERVLVDAETTRVRFIALSEEEIAGYAARATHGQGGAYAIQGRPQVHRPDRRPLLMR
jgi:septum formation protein